MLLYRLEIQTHTEDSHKRARIDAAVIATVDFWIDTLILRDGEHVLSGKEYTTVDFGVEQLFERVS